MFSISNAIAGAGQAVADVAGEAAKTFIARDANLDLLKARADIEAERDARINEYNVSLVSLHESTRQAGRQSDINQDTSPENVGARARAIISTNEMTLPSKIAEKEALGFAETKIELDKFSTLAPVKRQEAIDSAVAVLRAQSTPEMLRAERQIAQAKHIVDPSYTAMAQSDGTVVMVNTRNPRDAKLLEVNGTAVVRKDPEELKAATSVINMASANLRIAQAEHKAAVSDIGADPATKAGADAAWKSAQDEARRVTAPAYAVLFGKAGIPDNPPSGDRPGPTRQPSASDITGLKKRAENPSAIEFFDQQFGAGASQKYLGAPEKKPAASTIQPSQTSGLQAQIDFDADAASMSAPALVAKYGPLESGLTMPQVQKLQQARANVPKRVFPGLLNSAYAGGR